MSKRLHPSHVYVVSPICEEQKISHLLVKNHLPHQRMMYMLSSQLCNCVNSFQERQYPGMVICLCNLCHWLLTSLLKYYFSWESFFSYNTKCWVKGRTRHTAKKLSIDGRICHHTWSEDNSGMLLIVTCLKGLDVTCIFSLFGRNLNFKLVYIYIIYFLLLCSDPQNLITN